MSVIVPPDDNCNAAYQQILAIAHAHALVIDSNEISVVLAPPDVQRDLEIREQVLATHCMVEPDTMSEEEIREYKERVTAKSRERSKRSYGRTTKPMKVARPLRDMFLTETVKRALKNI